MSFPERIFLFSGKRKSGKDYVAENLQKRLGDKVSEIVRISKPLKGHYAKTHNLDLDSLMGDGQYKETYRQDMIKWGESVRQKDYGYFCRATCDEAGRKQIWIVSDIRRKTDLKWFQENYGDKITTVRISADEAVRKARGWVFTEGVDDGESECDLDDIKTWDFTLVNNSTQDGEKCIDELLKHLRQS